MSFQSFIKDSLWFDVDGADALRRQLTMNYVVLVLVMSVWAGVASATFHLPSEAMMTKGNFIALHVIITGVFGSVCIVLIQSIRSIYASRRALAIKPPPLLDYQWSFIWAGVDCFLAGVFALFAVYAWVMGDPVTLWLIIAGGASTYFASNNFLQGARELNAMKSGIDQSDRTIIPLHPSNVA